ncbi:hypothetical protein TNCV_4558841 [Trichonephila clavipes]|nr:hypothetical protein TNCV_4558841 [Trichonephila clavipes]
MPWRCKRQHCEQLSDFERERIVGIRKADRSKRRIGHHLGQSDTVVLGTMHHGKDNLPSWKFGASEEHKTA